MVVQCESVINKYLDCVGRLAYHAARMPINRKLVTAIIVGFVLFFALARTGVLRNWGKVSKPLGEAPRIELPSAEISQSERQQFLEGDFAIVKDVKALPRKVAEAFTEQGGSRSLMANPGQTFEVTDEISDSSMPSERLIFAGVLNDKGFVHYEQGGRAHMYILAFFNVASPSGVKMLWRGYCNAPASNLQELQVKLKNGECS